MPAVAALDQRHTLALEGPREDDGRAAVRVPRFGQRIQQLAEIVSVDHDGVPAEGAPAPRVRVHVVAPLGRPALAEAVDVGDDAQVVEVEIRPGLRRFPHRSLRRLAVAQQYVGAVIGSKAARIQGNPDCCADPLPKGPGRDVDERQPGRGVTFEVALQSSQRQQLAAVDEAGLGPGCVQQRRRVALRQHEPVVVVVLRVARIEPHLPEEQSGDDIRRRAAARRVAAAGLGRGAHGLDTEPGGDGLQRRYQGRPVGGQAHLRCGVYHGARPLYVEIEGRQRPGRSIHAARLRGRRQRVEQCRRATPVFVLSRQPAQAREHAGCRAVGVERYERLP